MSAATEFETTVEELAKTKLEKPKKLGTCRTVLSSAVQSLWCRTRFCTTGCVCVCKRAARYHVLRAR